MADAKKSFRERYETEPEFKRHIDAKQKDRTAAAGTRRLKDVLAMSQGAASATKKVY